MPASITHELIARKYGGELSAFVKGDVFRLNIIFPRRPKDN